MRNAPHKSLPDLPKVIIMVVVRRGSTFKEREALYFLAL